MNRIKICCRISYGVHLAYHMLCWKYLNSIGNIWKIVGYQFHIKFVILSFKSVWYKRMIKFRSLDMNKNIWDIYSINKWVKIINK